MNGRGGKPSLVKFCLAFQREALSVPVTRRVLGDILRTVGVGDDSISDILLAATEACSNVLRHGAPRATGYAVVLIIGADRCEVEVAEDWAAAERTVGEAVQAAEDAQTSERTYEDAVRDLEQQLDDAHGRLAGAKRTSRAAAAALRDARRALDRLRRRGPA